jgi:hypothetical protein
MAKPNSKSKKMEQKDGDTIIRISTMFYDLCQVISEDIPIYPGDLHLDLNHPRPE